MSKRENYYVYILTNKSNTLYIGVTDDLRRRVWEHQNKINSGFTERYNISKLIYYENYDDIEIALNREKQLKNWHRQWKINLIKETNPNFEELIV